VTFFGRRDSNGSKVKTYDTLGVEDCSKISKLYETLYAHPLDNGDYLAYIFEGVGGREGKGILLIGFCIFLTITRSR